MNSLSEDPVISLRRLLTIGRWAAAILVIGFGGWSATAEIAGAVLTKGLLVVESDVKKVQHQSGGVVGSLNVREGLRVSAGDVLLKLDATVIKANLAIVENTLLEQQARRARLEAERDQQDEIVFPAGLIERSADPEVERVLSAERKLFDFRRASRVTQKSQLVERISQLGQQIQALRIQAGAKADERALIERELEGVRDLLAKNLVPISRAMSLERDATRIEGERGALLANIAQLESRIGETKLQILQIEQDLRSEVAKDLQDAQAKSAEQRERRIATLDQLNRIEIRAPQNGVVHQLAVHAAGAVVTPGDTIMVIVPTEDDLLAQVKVPAENVDQIFVGQAAGVRFTGLNQRTTPELDGIVLRVSANAELEQSTGLSFYTVRITIPASEKDRIEGVKLVPGMPVEAFVRTGGRTAISYLTKPLSDQIARAFRER
jgi:HlyD family secretion protein